MRRLLFAAAFFCLASPLQAKTYHFFSYFDAVGNVCAGVLQTVADGNHDGSVWVTDGWLIVTDSSDDNKSTGVYRLVPTATSNPTFPKLGFPLCQILYPAGDSPLDTTGDGGDFLTGYGLVFQSPDDGTQVVIGDNGGGDYGIGFADALGDIYIGDWSGGSFFADPLRAKAYAGAVTLAEALLEGQ